MGGVHIDVDDMLSTSDLDEGAFDFDSKPRPLSVRINPKAVVWLAKRGHWISISEKKIDDKSKADVLQKMLVVMQVLWMVIQCIARAIYDLPLSLLEIHTMVHVICALILYMCWFKKPLNVQEPEVVVPKHFKGEIALLLQRQLYSGLSTRLALYPRKDSPNQPSPPPADYGRTMRWIEPSPGSLLQAGDVLPSGLGYHGFRPIDMTDKFLNRWNALLETFPFEGRAELARTAKRTNIDYLHHNEMPLFLKRLDEFSAGDRRFYRNLPFGEGKRNIDINIREVSLRMTDTFGLLVWPFVFCAEFPWLMVLAVFLSAAYGGVHLSAWNSVFPSYLENFLWKTSCVFVAGFLPVAVIVGFLFIRAVDWMPNWTAKWTALIVVLNDPMSLQSRRVLFLAELSFKIHDSQAPLSIFEPSPSTVVGTIPIAFALTRL
ncbi:hypothetical protein F53441_13890 [Fusarium austroafricanum]|uniref:Uncharacterized protein n=1 Tax=Fusarium austroafricanum TaxID=2364996 RepID=A0A8H4JK83_9HYPO|nr:hypothetical protein F53441_13890 [Fusarium austroafricanum]